MKIAKKVVLYLLSVILLYLMVGYLFHWIIFPEPEVDVSNYFQPGDVFYSQMEGFKQTVLKQENGKVYCKVEVEPHAPGPPLHIHVGFDELFEIQSGELSILVDGKKITLKPGKTYLVEKGTPHKPFNETDSTIVAVMKEFAFPEEFAVYLSQVYAYMDESQENLKPPKVIFQMALLNQYFDSYLGEGPPVAIQRVQNFLIVPIARLLGYKSFYEKFRL